MLRILVIIFFWLCAIGLLTLSIWAEVNNSPSGKDSPMRHATARTDRSNPIKLG